MPSRALPLALAAVFFPVCLGFELDFESFKTNLKTVKGEMRNLRDIGGKILDEDDGAFRSLMEYEMQLKEV